MEKLQTEVTASVVVPIYNEEKHLETCVNSLLEQDFPHDRMEILLVDGMSTDRTPALLEQLQSSHPALIRVLQNPRRNQSAAVNLGARAARGDYLIRIDAHAEYPRQYVSRCISLLEETGSMNAGCIMRTAAHTPTGSVIAKMLTSPFGIGGASFRVGGKSGYAETVPFGTFRRAEFLALGGFDERLVRNEDNEFNRRILKCGGKIYMTNEMEVIYYCRDTVRALSAMAFANGKWNVIAERLCPGAMSLKYFVPMAFTLSLILLPLLSLLHRAFGLLLAAELILYLGLALGFTLKKTHRLREVFFLWYLFPAFHVPYGFGSICGVYAILTGRWKKSAAVRDVRTAK